MEVYIWLFLSHENHSKSFFLYFSHGLPIISFIKKQTYLDNIF